MRSRASLAREGHGAKERGLAIPLPIGCRKASWRVPKRPCVKCRLVLLCLLFLISFECAARAHGGEATWKELSPIHPNKRTPFSLLWAPGGEKLISLVPAAWYDRVDRRFREWPDQVDVIDLARGRVLKRLHNQGQDLVAAAWMPDGRLGVVFNERGGSQKFSTWDPTTWKRASLRTLYVPHQGPGGSIEHSGAVGKFSPDGTLFVGHYGHWQGRVVPPLRYVCTTIVWRTSDWSVAGTWMRLRGGDSPFLGFVGGDHLLADSPTVLPNLEADVRYSTIETVSRLTLPYYRLSHGKATQEAQVSLWGPISAHAWSADGRMLATGVINNRNGSLFVRRVRMAPFASRRVLDDTARLSADRHYTAVAFSPDGRWLAAGLSDGQVRMWRTATWEPARETVRHRFGVSLLSFAPDSHLLVAAYDDGRLRRWRLGP